MANRVLGMSLGAIQGVRSLSQCMRVCATTASVSKSGLKWTTSYAEGNVWDKPSTIGLARILSPMQGTHYMSTNTMLEGAESFDWDKLYQGLSSDEAKREVGALKKTYLDMIAKVKAVEQKQQPIDFAAFRKSVDPKIVDGFEAALKALDSEIPAYDGSDLKDADAAFKGLLAKAQANAEAAKKALAEIKVKEKAIEEAKERLKTATVDEELAKNPELAMKFDKEIEDGKW